MVVSTALGCPGPDSCELGHDCNASHQCENTVEPRQLENPHIRTEDISTVIDYLTTLPYVYSDRIGAMGICTGRGYTTNAAINDRRVKALER